MRITNCDEGKMKIDLLDAKGELVVLVFDGVSDNYLIGKEKHEYEFDVKGNWIKETVFENDKAQGVIERIIIYHN